MRQLLAAGYKDLHCFKRASSDLRLLGDLATKVSWHDIDLLDIVSIARHIKDASAIIHAAALVSFAPSDKRELLQFNIEGTANLVNASLDTSIEKFIHISSIATLARNKVGKLINESTDAMGSRISSPYAISKFRSEMEVWRGGGEGLPISILNPSVVIGSGIWNRGSASMFKQVFKGLSFYPSGTTGFVDVRDVARAVLPLLEKEIHQERFLISGENRSYQEILRLIATELGVRTPSIRLNSILNEVAFLFSKLTVMLSSDAKVITRASLHSASETYLFDNTKSKAILDLDYIPIAQTIKQTCQQLKLAAVSGYPPSALPLK